MLRLLPFMFTSAREVLLCTVYEPEGSWLGVRKLLLHLQQHNVLFPAGFILFQLTCLVSELHMRCVKRGGKKEKVVRL